MKMKLPRGFKTFAKKHAKNIKARLKNENDPLNFYDDDTGEYSSLKIHEDANGKAYLEIYDSIGWMITDQDVAVALRGFEGETLEVRINCGGGDVFMGLGIAAILSAHDAKITAKVEGICASIATVIALGCDEIEMVTGSQFMVHGASMLFYANAEEAREIADWLEKTTAGIIDIYEERTSIDRVEIEALVAAETFMSAQETVDAGFADRVVKLKSAKKKEPEAIIPDPSLAAKAKRQRQAKALAIQGGRFPIA